MEEHKSKTVSFQNKKVCLKLNHCADEAYVQFHDECWGVPVYSDKYLPPHFSSNLPVTVTLLQSQISVLHPGHLRGDLQPPLRASVAVRDAHRPQLDGDTQEARHVQVILRTLLLPVCSVSVHVSFHHNGHGWLHQGGVRRLRPQHGGQDGRGRRRRDQRQQGAQAGRVQGPVHRRERQVHPEGESTHGPERTELLNSPQSQHKDEPLKIFFFAKMIYFFLNFFF